MVFILCYWVSKSTQFTLGDCQPANLLNAIYWKMFWLCVSLHKYIFCTKFTLVYRRGLRRCERETTFNNVRKVLQMVYSETKSTTYKLHRNMTIIANLVDWIHERLTLPEHHRNPGSTGQLLHPGMELRSVHPIFHPRGFKLTNSYFSAFLVLRPVVTFSRTPTCDIYRVYCPLSSVMTVLLWTSLNIISQLNLTTILPYYSSSVIVIVSNYNVCCNVQDMT